MKSWKLIEHNTVDLVTSQSAPIDSNDFVKVKIELAAVSQTDARIFGDPESLPLPFTLGRHGVGIVSETHDIESFFSRGEKVVIEPFVPCGKCIFCRTKRSEKCVKMDVMGINIDGLFSDFIVVNAERVHKLPQSMPFDTAIFSENVATALSVINKIDVSKGDHIAILSGNKTANVLAQLVIYYQGIPILIDDNEQAVNDARTIGVEYAYAANRQGIAEEVLSITGGRMCEKVVCFGDKMNIDLAFSLASGNGIICICNKINNNQLINLQAVSEKQITLLTVNDGYSNFPSAINLLATKAVDVRGLYSKKISFASLGKELPNLDTEELRYKYVLVEY